MGKKLTAKAQRHEDKGTKGTVVTFEKMKTNFEPGSDFYCVNEEIGDRVKCHSQCKECEPIKE